MANRHFYLLCLLDLGHPRKYIYICTEHFSLVARGSGEGDLQPLQLSHPHSRSVLQPFPMEDWHQALSPGSLSIWFHCSIFIFWHKIQDTFRSLLLTGRNLMNKLMLILCDQPWRGAEEESQHHRITQVRRTHSKVSGPASCPKQGQLQHPAPGCSELSPSGCWNPPRTEPAQAVPHPGTPRRIPLRLCAVSITSNISVWRGTATETTALFWKILHQLQLFPNSSSSLLLLLNWLETQTWKEKANSIPQLYVTDKQISAAQAVYVTFLITLLLCHKKGLLTTANYSFTLTKRKHRPD